jgi:serine protease Do
VRAALSLSRPSALALALLLGAAAQAQGRIERLDALFERLAPSVVTVKVGLKRMQLSKSGARIDVGVGFGSGVVLHAGGFIATAAHVVEDAEAIEVEFSDGSTSEAEIITLSRTEDLALIRAETMPAKATVAVLADSDAVKVGQPVFAIGAPLGLKATLTTGVVSAARGEELGGLGPKKLLQTDAAMNQGNSGGPLFNERGEVIGIASRIATVSGGSMGLGFAIPSNSVRHRLFEQPLPWLGMSMRFVGRAMAETFNWAVTQGLLVEKVRPGSPAAKAGIRGGEIQATVGDTAILLGGDILVKMAGFEFDDLSKVASALAALKEGDELTYTVLRGGKSYDATVKVPAWKRPPKLEAPKKR